MEFGSSSRQHGELMFLEFDIFSLPIPGVEASNL
jgi:hypothetical protein